MSRSTAGPRATRVQKLCTLWTHDENFSRDDVVFNGDKFAELPTHPGSLIRIIALKQTTAVRDFQAGAKSSTIDGMQANTEHVLKEAHPDSYSRRSRRHSLRVTLDENGTVLQGGREVDSEKSYIFVARPMPPDLRSKHPTLQISITEKIAKVFKFRNRTQVVVTTADEETHSASHVEIAFRDEYLARADMWRMAISELSFRTVYRGQNLLFMGTIKATVKNVYINGQSKHSGYFSSMTKPVFRSESARYVLFIQMSKEMWDFDAEGAGEIIFNKVVNGFLPDLFKRWIKINAKHLVTIILFTRMHYDESSPADESPDQNSFARYTADSCGRRFRDYYRVVVSEMASGDWINILYQLKKEFRAFLRDVSIVPKQSNIVSPEPKQASKNWSDGVVLAGKPSTATYGNILEAINLAAAQFARDYIDRDLVRTGISVVVITAGTGVFEVDYNLLKLTTDTLVGSGIGIDLVCLSPMPLHSVPLFKYRNPRSISSFNRSPGPSPDKLSPLQTFEEQDEKTPRQNQHDFGSAGRSPSAKVPPVLGNGSVPSNEASEWRYAMPHWVDVSFWSGPSEEIIELMNPRRSSTDISKTKKKKSTSFALRCRMYELQMMGVMESELGNITIPYLEEDSQFSPGLRGYLDGTRDLSSDKVSLAKKHSDHENNPTKSEDVAADADKNISKSEYQAWMEAYDQQVFAQIPVGGTSDNPLHNPAHESAGSYERRLKDVSLASSFESPTHSFPRSARPPPDTNFYQLMRERSKELDIQSPRGTPPRGTDVKGSAQPRADILYRQMSSAKLKDLGRSQNQSRGSQDLHQRRESSKPSRTGSPAPSRGNTPPKRTSSYTTPPSATRSAPKVEKSSRSGNWFLRQISFSGLGFNATPATSVDASITSVNVKPARLTVENNQKGLIAAKLASTRNQEVEGRSQPIAIRKSRAGTDSGGSPTSEAPKSVETVRKVHSEKPAPVTDSNSVTKNPGSLFLFASSRGLREQVGPRPAISTNGAGQQIPQTLSPTSALSPWAVLVNPCNPKKNSASIPGQFRRWQHVFPKRLKTSSMKWKSLCSPAAVPLTNEYFPTAEQLATEWNESPYKLTQNDDDDGEVPKPRESLVRELIAFRLSHGFQIIIGSRVAEFVGSRDLSNIFDSEYMAKDGDTLFMCLGNTIHQLVCIAGGEVEVKRFNRKPMTALDSSGGFDAPLTYRPLIKTAFDDAYCVREVTMKPAGTEYNWNFIDTFLAGYHDEFDDVLRFWRARFVLIPVDIPTANRRPLPLLPEDSEEEVRLEGIRKLTQVWQRYRYMPQEERQSQATTSKKQKDPNPLAIEYQTRDPSVIVAAGPDSAFLAEGEIEPTSLFSDAEQYHTGSLDVKKLAEDLQSERGIHMADRRWHWKLHYNCFVGFDLTNWLLQNFKDLETRDEAVNFGNQLMIKGLFQHVQGKHQFRDGNFFYQIAPEYRAPRPEARSGWFGIRRTDRSVPSTPLSEGPRSSPLSGRGSRSRPSTSGSTDSASEGLGSGEKTPTRAGTPRRTVTLSRVMRYDVDSRKRSYRPEVISLHYDRLHNPDNCYHIRIEWMNVTAKLIEDAIVTWATSVEKYGLRLVEVPIAEASSISEHHPFRTPYVVKLALKPPKSPPEHFYDTSHFGAQIKSDPFAYHKAVLRRLNYVLDMESASSFPSDVDVRYSWGVPDYRYTQFIHRSGTVLVQITDDGNFILLANRLVNNRASSSRDTGRFRPGPESFERRITSAERTTSTTAVPSAVSTPSERPFPHRSPFSSPLARPVQDSSLLHTQIAVPEPPKAAPPVIQTPEQIKEEFEAFCSDPIALKAFYAEAFRQAPSPSPRMTPVLDNNIPSLGLPPAISIREASWRDNAGTHGISPGAGPGAWSLGPGIGGIAGRDGRRGSEGNVMTLALAKRQGSEGSVYSGPPGSGDRERDRMPRRQESGGTAGTG